MISGVDSLVPFSHLAHPPSHNPSSYPQFVLHTYESLLFCPPPCFYIIFASLPLCSSVLCLKVLIWVISFFFNTVVCSRLSEKWLSPKNIHGLQRYVEAGALHPACRFQRWPQSPKVLSALVSTATFTRASFSRSSWSQSDLTLPHPVLGDGSQRQKGFSLSPSVSQRITKNQSPLTGVPSSFQAFMPRKAERMWLGLVRVYPWR